jgi:organic radical activating enzyme
VPDPAAPLAEVFLSLQGEGPWVGVPQLFVRVRGCDLTCRYCDSAAARALTGAASFCPAGCVPFTTPNPVPLGDLLTVLDAWRPTQPLHSLALTGGEPLLYPEFVLALGAALRERGLPLYLETAGHLSAALAQVLPVVDYFALDFKLPHTLAEPVPVELFAESARLTAGREAFVKIVVTDQTPEAELAQAARLLAEISPPPLVILQPVTGRSAAGGPPEPGQLLAWQRLASERLPDVRVIPQCHKLLGLR